MTEFKLHECANPYRVLSKRGGEIPEYEVFQRRILYILNRLSPENSAKLTVEFLNLPLDCEQNLKDCVQLVWFKCVLDHVYAPLYAKLCRLTSETRVELQFMPTKYVSFGAALVKKCQQELLLDYKSHIDTESYAAQIERARDTNDEKKLNELRTDLDERLDQARRQYMGNLKFTAELYKLNMIEERILFEGIEVMFKRVEADQEYIIFICKLIELTADKLVKKSSSNEVRI